MDSLNKKKRQKLIHSEKSLPQKSTLWIEKRLEWGLGASEIPTILGKAPSVWCDPFELFLIKMGKPHEFSNKYIEIGNRDEEKARKLVQNYLKYCQNQEEKKPLCRNIYDRTGGFETKNANFKQFTVQYKHFPQLFASFDGIDIKNKLVLELKCPSQATFTKILKNRVPTIPKMYYDQIQMQLFIANSHWNITEGIFAVYFEEGIYFEDRETKITNLIKLILIKTELDLEYCEEMLHICKKYVKMIENRKWDKNWRERE